MQTKTATNFYEVLIEYLRPKTRNAKEDKDSNYCYFFITEAENRTKAIIKAEKFISHYFKNENSGIKIDMLTYKYSDGEIIKIKSIKETTPEAFLKERIGDMFWIN